jgi:ABC-type multidrug transport system ATPase subunit
VTLLSLQGIRKGFSSTCVIWDASAEFNPGIHLIGGGNGVGKTTLLTLVAGLECALAGQVLLDGVPVRQARADMAFAPATPQFFDGVSVDAAVRLYLSLCGRRVPKDVFAALDPFALRDHRRKTFGDLSLGLQKRVQLHMVVAADPQVLLLDEPTVGLDSESVAALGDAIASRRRETITIVTSHDPGWLVPAELHKHVLVRGERGSILLPAE